MAEDQELADVEGVQPEDEEEDERELPAERVRAKRFRSFIGFL